MEGSNSETHRNRVNYGNVDNEDIIMSFGSFGLHEDGNTRLQASGSHSNNGFGIASSQTPRENNSNDRLSTNLVPDHYNIWANHDFTPRGEKLVEDLLSGPENFAGGSNRKLSINSLSGYSFTPNSVNRRTILNDYQSSRTTTQNQGVERNSPFSRNGYYLKHDQTNSGGLWNQNVELHGSRYNLYRTGTTQFASNCLSDGPFPGTMLCSMSSLLETHLLLIKYFSSCSRSVWKLCYSKSSKDHKGNSASTF